MGMSTGCLHGASRRARRWAVIMITDEAMMLNGATPMFFRRVERGRASLVCRVDSTRWPVWAALTEISAVSRSRISPTMITSGSWRRKARSGGQPKVRPAFSFDVDLVDAGQVDFGRVFGGADVDAGFVEDVEAGVERHRLAAAGGAGDEDHAVGAATASIRAAFWSGS